ncbi:DNA polymerase I [Candidatus Protochlamydia phocaeensis]|uniref:DNA polymerase I n=1 Tax=Candidatus Protochlamydia phocaeensis TaxID=1414722 RepID=UPI0008392E0A|nr:DNA polymerase I [Candidatus Protochlamydia phocaeensis]
MEKIYILDASGYIFRSYFAIRQMTNAKGESTNALFGFIRSVLKLMKDFQPTHLVAVFDGPNNARKRTEMYADYKAHRKEMPKDLLYQILWAQQFCQLMAIPELMVPEVEADDTMGSIAQWAAQMGTTTYLCTSDKDMCQLVNDRIFILNTFKENLILDSKGVEGQFGVKPEQMVDYLSITGDASDNVPGLSGFGPKTASDLLRNFGTLDYLLEHPQEVPGKKKQETLLQERDKVLLSRRLVTIDTQVPFPQQADFFKLGEPSWKALKDFYNEMSFSSLIREMENQASPGINKTKVLENVSYLLVDDEKSLDELIAYLSHQKEICIDTETTSVQPLKSELVGIGLGVEPQKAWYIPVNGNLGLNTVIHKLKPLFTNPAIGFYGHNFKYDYHVLSNYHIQPVNICFDTILASYLLNSHSRQHSLDHLALELFDKVKIPIQDLIGRGKKQLSMKDVPLDKICNYCCEDVDYTVRLKQALEPQLQERGLVSLFKDLELPLLPILAKMERHGIFIDIAYLQHLSGEISKEIQELEQTIFEMAGESFNLNSPKQLSEILFVKLGIKPPKKTATGHSTNAEVLESLKHEYPIAAKILEYRTLEKLRSTYIDTLPQEVHSVSHRIHCNFNQSVTATGRLSCQDPNLQNIPVRTAVGRKIREAFRPQKSGWSYLAADYSQIELRLLAHLSEDPVLISAFTANEDIHAFTASLIFGIPLEEVSKEQRHQAKAVNFGIIYGQQAFGLAQELGINTKTAATFIHLYFQRYQKVKEFLDTCKERVRQTGKAVTLFGRERLIPEINSQNGMIRAMAERFAVNTPIQGTQADLIKMAMLQIERKLEQRHKKAYMILQIHDELIFEVPNEELEEVTQLVRETMEGIMPLKVPLVVDIHIGKNWKEC